MCNFVLVKERGAGRAESGEKTANCPLLGHGVVVGGCFFFYSSVLVEK